MLRRATVTSSAAIVAVSAATQQRNAASRFRVTRGNDMFDENTFNANGSLPTNKLRYDLFGPRYNTQTRVSNMSEAYKAKNQIATLDDFSLTTDGEPALAWIEDAKNWDELNKADWEDIRKNEKKNFVQPRGFF